MQTKEQQIEALGLLLSWYRKDLEFFLSFQRFDRGGRKDEGYYANTPGSFQRFINSYQVARTIEAGQTLELLTICMQWHDKQQWMDVSGLASAINERIITHGFPLSLASKVMFLMRPEEVLPFDKRAKNTLEIKESRPDYRAYHQMALDFGTRNEPIIDQGLSRISDMLDTLEQGYQELDISFPKVRRMRMLDKLLWVGQ
jgi:hypothetical protein